MHCIGVIWNCAQSLQVDRLRRVPSSGRHVLGSEPQLQRNKRGIGHRLSSLTTRAPELTIDNGGTANEIKARKISDKISVAVFKQLGLLAAANAAAGGFAVAGVQGVGRFHAFNNAANGDERFAVMRG